uniref:P-type ATPase N-terminal domain-containing protein n=1 Tax=Sinocyclocheilus grahami TaxID=75366 RepID=A0A672RF50_SINGR
MQCSDSTPSPQTGVCSHRESGQKSLTGVDSTHFFSLFLFLSEYEGNAIKTNKHRLWSFIPMSLFEQFHRMANIYFVGLAFLNFVTVVNVLQPEVALIPICVILALTAVKDGCEDFRRYQTDQQLNNTPCFIFTFRTKCFVFPPYFLITKCFNESIFSQVCPGF